MTATLPNNSIVFKKNLNGNNLELISSFPTDLTENMIRNFIQTIINIELQERIHLNFEEINQNDTITFTNGDKIFVNVDNKTVSKQLSEQETSTSITVTNDIAQFTIDSNSYTLTFTNDVQEFTIKFDDSENQGSYYLYTNDNKKISYQTSS